VAADATEEEQVEALKKWFEENGVSLVVGIVLALGGVFGYRAWENSSREAGEAASAIYEDLVAAVGATPGVSLSDEMTATGISLAERLKAEYGDSSYALFGALYMAKVAVESGDLDRATNELRWVLDHGAKGSFEVLARIRLSRVLSAQGKFEEALSVLDVRLDLAAHRSSWEEARGDVYFSMERFEDAREAYQLAVQNVTQGSKPYLNMKLEDLTYAKVSTPAEEAEAEQEPEESSAPGSTDAERQ
jgi:predicted negative regulator of RcsB-dependent stress response